MITAAATPRLALRWDPAAEVSFLRGDCLDLLAAMPDGAARMIVTLAALQHRQGLRAQPQP